MVYSKTNAPYKSTFYLLYISTYFFIIGAILVAAVDNDAKYVIIIHGVGVINKLYFVIFAAFEESMT